MYYPDVVVGGRLLPCTGIRVIGQKPVVISFSVFLYFVEKPRCTMHVGYQKRDNNMLLRVAVGEQEAHHQ